MATVPNIRETRPMEVTMDNFRGKRRLTGAIDDAGGDELEKWCEEYEASRKDHKPRFEISIAWDDDDEFEHEGYYSSVNDAIAALMKYKNKYMRHTIQLLDYPYPKSETAILKELNNFAYDPYHGGNLKFHKEPVYASREEAIAGIGEIDEGWYHDHAVRYREGDKIFWLVKCERHY